MKNFFVFLLSVCVFPCMAQQVETASINSTILTTKVESVDALIFPEKCLGVWEGMMHIYQYNTLRDSVKVRFTAAKTDTSGRYTWKTEYLSPTTPVVKDYELVVDDLKKGRYLLDEGDGVKLVEYNVSNKLYSLFKVNDIYLTSTTELLENALIFEVTSGKEIAEEKGVVNYSFANVQRVVLYKIQ
ncbi:MAG: hypothetical protein AAF611_04390 [Bacteroidota bacterium]